MSVNRLKLLLRESAICSTLPIRMYLPMLPLALATLDFGLLHDLV